MLLKIYRLLSAILYPALWVYLQWRIRHGKEEPARLKERFGHAGLPRPDGPLLWVHAVSVGESNAILPLINTLSERYPALHILMTTGTVTSAKNIHSRLPANSFHQYIPVDTPSAVKRFVRYWKPSLALWVESELWPNMLCEISARDIPLYVVNGRMSRQSFRRWMGLRHSASQLFSAITHIFAASDEDAKKFKNLGVSQVESAGNIKYDAPALTADPKITGDILAKMGDRRLWLAASTHGGEEAIAADVHLGLKETFPELLTMIAPRHPDRRDAVLDMLKKKKLTVSCRSKEQIILPETDIYLIDTLGELGIFYRLTGVVFMGGSMVPVGGHNPIEPAFLDCAILCGPHMHNFKTVVKDLTSGGGMMSVTTVAELIERVGELLRDHDRQEEIARKAHEVVESHAGVSEHVLNALAPKLHALCPSADSPSETQAVQQTV